MTAPFLIHSTYTGQADGSYVGKEGWLMAKTEKGKKIVPVKPYTRKVDGDKVKVKRHRRSTPN